VRASLRDQGGIAFVRPDLAYLPKTESGVTGEKLRTDSAWECLHRDRRRPGWGLPPPDRGGREHDPLPRRAFPAHPSDELAEFAIDPGPPDTLPRLPAPVSAEALSMNNSIQTISTRML